MKRTLTFALFFGFSNSLLATELSLSTLPTFLLGLLTGVIITFLALRSS